MSILRHVLANLVLLLLSRSSVQLDAGLLIYKDDVQVVQIDATAASEGFISYLDPDAGKKLTFFTGNQQVQSNLQSAIEGVTYSKSVRQSDAATFIVLIQNHRKLIILGVSPAEKGAIKYQSDIVPTTQTNTKCVDVFIDGEWAYALCLTPGTASSAQDTYLVKAFRFLNTGTTVTKEYTFSPKDANSTLTKEQAAIRGVTSTSNGVLLLAFNRHNLKALNASIDVTGAKTKFVYTVAIDQTDTTKHMYTDLWDADKKGSTEDIADFAAIYDIRVVTKGTNDLVHVLLSRGNPKSPHLFTFEFGGTAALRTLVNWAERQQLSEQTTIAVELCHDTDTYCLQGVINSTPKQVYQYTYTVEATTADFAAVTTVMKMPTYQDWYPVQFDGCHIVNSNFWACTQIYKDMPSDGALKLNIFELFYIDRTTTTYKMDRVFRGEKSFGGYQVFNSKPAGLILEGLQFNAFLIDDSTIANNKKNFLNFNAFRYQTSQTSPLKIKKIINQETSTADVDVNFKIIDFNTLLEATDSATAIKVTAFSNTYVEVPLPLDKVKGYGINFEIADASWNAAIFYDNQAEVFSATSQALATTGVQYYYFGKILVTQSKTQPGPLRVFECEMIKNLTMKKLQLNCTFKEELKEFTGTLLVAEAVGLDFAAMLFKTSATAAAYVTFNKTIKSKSLTENVQEAMFKWYNNQLYLGYIYKDSNNKNIAKLSINDKDGAELTLVSETASTLLADNAWMASVPNDISIYVLDERTSDNILLMRKLKQDDTNKKLFVEDIRWDVSSTKRESGKKLQVCMAGEDRFIYWYEGTTSAAYLSLMYGQESLGLGLSELGISEIQKGKCGGNGQFILIGKTAESTVVKTVAYIYSTIGDMKLASNRLTKYRSDFGKVIESVVPISTSAGVAFGGFNGNDANLRILSTPMIAVKKEGKDAQELTIKVLNKIKSVEVKYSFSLVEYVPANYKTKLVTGNQLDSNKTYSVESMVNIGQVPVITAELLAPDGKPVILAVLKPRLRFDKYVDKASSRRMLVQSDFSAFGRHRLLQTSQVSLPVFVKTKDNITLAVYESTTGTQALIYNDSDVFEKNIDLLLGTTIRCPTLDFAVERTFQGKLNIHIIGYCSDSKLRYFKVGATKLDTQYMKIEVQTLTSVKSTKLLISKSQDPAFLIAYLYNTVDSKLKAYGIKVNDATSTATFSDVYTADKGKVL
jgi:hypothetical protein